MRKLICALAFLTFAGCATGQGDRIRDRTNTNASHTANDNSPLSRVGKRTNTGEREQPKFR